MFSPFASRFGLVRARYGPLVWRTDPSGGLLDRLELGDDPDGLDRFADIVLDAAVGAVRIIKPQLAFCERHGWRDVRTLTRIVADARSAGIHPGRPRRQAGDVGSTNDAYAEAYLGKGTPIEADALTVHPYLGIGAMGAFMSRAHEAGSRLFVVTRSFNPEGRAVQGATDRERQTVETSLLERIGSINSSLAPGVIGPVGAVIATPADASQLDLQGPNALYLVAGVGAQGATPHSVADVFRSCPDRVLPSASRALLAAGPDAAPLRAAVTAVGGDRSADPRRQVASAEVSRAGGR